MRCPKCGSDKGWEETLIVHQYYDMRGNPHGSHTESLGVGFVKCVSCGKRMKKTNILPTAHLPDSSKKRKYNRKCGKCGDIHEQSEMLRTTKTQNGWICYRCIESEEEFDNVF